MILPDKEFIEVFKKTPGALSVTESIAIMNISNQAPSGGIWCEGGTHKGKSAMSAIYGATQAVEFHLIDTEFEKTISTKDISTNISSITKNGVRVVFIIEQFANYLKQSDFKYSFVFSDAGIHDDEVMEEMKLLEDKIIPNGIICMHDCGNQFTAVQRAYDYLVSTGKFEPISIDWEPIIEYVRENDLENGNDSWHIYEEHPYPNFVGAVRRK